MRVELAVNTITGREEYLSRTLESLPDRVNVFKDVGDNLIGGHYMVWDKLFDSGAQYATIFQDDIIACKNTAAALDYVSSEYNIDFMTLFNPSEFSEDIPNGIVELDGEKHPMTAQGVFMSRQFYKGFKKWCKNLCYVAEVPSKDYNKDDVMYSYYLNSKDIQPYTTNPPLIQHVGEESSIGNNWVNYIRGERSNEQFDKSNDALDIVKEFNNDRSD